MNNRDRALRSLGLTNGTSTILEDLVSGLEICGKAAGTPLFPTLQPYAYSLWVAWAKESVGRKPDENATRVLKVCERSCQGPFSDKASEASSLHMYCQTLVLVNGELFVPSNPVFDFDELAKHQHAEPLPPVVNQVVNIARRGLTILERAQLKETPDANAFRSAIFRGLYRQCRHSHSPTELFDEALKLGTLLMSPRYTGPEEVKDSMRRQTAYLHWGRSCRRGGTAIHDLTQAIASAEGLPGMEGTVAVCYAERAARRGRCDEAREDIVHAVRLTRVALGSANEEDMRRYCRWNLGRRLLSLYEYTGSTHDLDDAIRLLEDFKDMDVVHDATMSEYRRGYFMALLTKARFLRDSSLKEEAAIGLKDLLRIIPDDEPKRKIRILTDLSNLEDVLNRRKEDRYTLDQLYPQLSIDVKDSLRFATYDGDLEAIWNWNGEHGEGYSDISPLISGERHNRQPNTDRQSLPIDGVNPQRRAYVSSLWSLGAKVGRDRSQRLRLLGLNQAARKKYRLAEFLFKKAIESTEDEHQDHALCLETIARYHRDRLFDRPAAEDIPESCLLQGVAVPIVCQRAVLACLANIHLHLTAAFACLRVAEYKPSSARSRASYGESAGGIFTNLHIWHHASLAFFSATAGLQDSLSSAATLSDLIQTAKERATISSSGSFAALKNGAEPVGILMHMEASRAVVLSMTIMDLPDLADLKIKLPDKFEEYKDSQKRFRTARDRLHNQKNYGSHDGDAHSEEVLNSWKRLHDLERRIRKHDTFHRFQLPPTSDEMRALAGSGAIISFNVTQEGMHAFTLTQRFGVRVIELPQVNFQTLVEHVLHSTGTSRLSLLPMDKRPYANKSMAKLLRWLWETVVYPILNHLNYEHQQEDDGPSTLPRIHWVTSSLMGALPLHAAGIYTKAGRSEQRTSRYALSSYTPSIKALAASRRKNLKPFDSLDDKMLLVGMRTTPGQSDLPQVINEMVAIRRAFSDGAGDGQTPIITFQPYIGGIVQIEPSPGKVLRELPTANAVHFACHGFSNPDDPTRSGLMVGRQEVYHGYAFPLPLTIEDISRLDLTQARLAYLSACVTATNSDIKAYDEAVHMASMLQIVGFPHVIGTMWEVDDTVSVSMAGEFYTWLRRLSAMDNAGFNNHDAVALALHMASEEIREESPANYLDWVPYIHFGA
jgi:hypothetical protein